MKLVSEFKWRCKADVKL